jgi:hypothetical protein
MAARTLRLIGLAGLATFAVHGGALAGGDDVLDDLFGPYRDRRDSITPGAGNAKDNNAAVHVIDPWPPRVGDRHIVYDGKRLGDAVHRYRKDPDPSVQTEPASSLLPIPAGAAPGAPGAPGTGAGIMSGGNASAGARP